MKWRVKRHQTVRQIASDHVNSDCPRCVFFFQEFTELKDAFKGWEDFAGTTMRHQHLTDRAAVATPLNLVVLLCA
eukprot:15485438-Alexandrium_andersonii.AAC.1